MRAKASSRKSFLAGAAAVSDIGRKAYGLVGCPAKQGLKASRPASTSGQLAKPRVKITGLFGYRMLTHLECVGTPRRQLFLKLFNITTSKNKMESLLSLSIYLLGRSTLATSANTLLTSTHLSTTIHNGLRHIYRCPAQRTNYFASTWQHCRYG